MGGFRLLWRISPRRAKAQCGQGIEGSCDLIGIAREKHNFQTRLTLSAMLALY
jgi:hypothetical protein